MAGGCVITSARIGLMNQNRKAVWLFILWKDCFPRWFSRLFAVSLNKNLLVKIKKIHFNFAWNIIYYIKIQYVKTWNIVKYFIDIIVKRGNINCTDLYFSSTIRTIRNKYGIKHEKVINKGWELRIIVIS